MGNGDAPHVVNGSQVDYKKLFYSDFVSALNIPVTLQAGYGVLEAGTALAKNLSAAGNAGKYLPYNPTSFDGSQDHPGRSYLVNNIASGETAAETTLDDSYKFSVGDDVVVNDSVESAINGGAITGIDRTTYVNKAVITFTSAITDGVQVVSNAYIAVEAGDNTNNYSDATCILAIGADTGEGANAAGTLVPALFSNAVLYTGSLVNFDAAAATDLSSAAQGKYTIFK